MWNKRRTIKNRVYIFKKIKKEREKTDQESGS